VNATARASSHDWACDPACVLRILSSHELLPRYLDRSRKHKKMPSTTFVDLSRWQFATTAAFHMTFPALSVGLAIFLVICYGAYCQTGNPLYLQMFRFWRKIFAVGFALGIVAGIVLTFELGLNWGNYARAVGPILGPIICMEALTAFFLEAGFIAGERGHGRRCGLRTDSPAR